MRRIDGNAPGSVEHAVADYLDWHALRGSCARHRQEVGRTLNVFAAAVGPERPVDAITREDCSSFLRTIQERGARPLTVKGYHRTVDAFYNWLLQEERLTSSPMKRVPKPKVPPHQIKPLTPEELAALLAQPDRKTFVGVRDAAFIALLADTGLRVSEALAIRVSDLDLQRHAIAVMGKGQRPRVVFFGDAVANQLRTYLRRRGEYGPEDLLFVNQYGEQLLRFAMGDRIRDYGAKAGIAGKRVSPHTLRHTFAVSWLMGGGDTLSHQRLLGHTTPTMTSRYVNFATGDLAQLHRTVSPLDRLAANTSGARPEQAARRRRLR